MEEFKDVNIEGRSFYSLALAYRRAADLLLDHLDKEHASHGESYLPIQFLYSHATELLLKAFLRLKGFSIDLAKRPYAHDLVKLYDESINHGLEVADLDQQSLRDLIRLLEDGHNDYQYRYFEKSFNTADSNWIRRDVCKLADAVEAEVEKQNQPAEKKAKEAGTCLAPVPYKLLISIGKGDLS